MKIDCERQILNSIIPNHWIVKAVAESFAAAVGAGDADLLADMQAEIDAFEQRPAGAGEGEIAQQDHNLLHHRINRRGKKALLYACSSR